MNKKLWKILARTALAVWFLILVDRDGLKGKPTGENREPQTANREPRTANREPQTANRESQTANREPRTANREPQTANREPLNVSGFRIKKIASGRIFTPNGDDWWNRYFEICYENLGDAIISAKIYDIKGRYVSGMTNDRNKEILRWDGKDIKGKLLRGGVYIYQIEISGYETAVIKGAVILAR